jgi:hypothetical protein
LSSTTDNEPFKTIYAAVYFQDQSIGIWTRTWGGSAIGGDIVLELTPSFFFNFNYYKITANFSCFYFIEQYNRQRALQKHLCRCLFASWNLDQNLGETYEYVLEIADRPSRLGVPEGLT